jgi:5'-3' exoribonuclease 2
LPSLDIAEGGLNTLLDVYKKILPQAGGYITDAGRLHVERLELIFRQLSTHEDAVFQMRIDEAIKEKHKNRRRNRKNVEFDDDDLEGAGEEGGDDGGEGGAPVDEHEKAWLDAAILKERFRGLDEKDEKKAHAPAPASGLGPAATAGPAPTVDALAAMAAKQAAAVGADGAPVQMPDEYYDANSYHPLSKEAQKRYQLQQEAAAKQARDGQCSAPVPPLAVRRVTMTAAGPTVLIGLCVAGNRAAEAVSEAESKRPKKDFRLLYYTSKFPEFFDPSRELTPAPHLKADADGKVPDVKRDVWVPLKGVSPRENVRALCKSYLESLVWVLQYYYDGCTSWKWFFPFRYAPLASDMVELHKFNIAFELGQPFRPLEQLMAVLPPASSKVRGALAAPPRNRCSLLTALLFATYLLPLSLSCMAVGSSGLSQSDDVC